MNKNLAKNREEGTGSLIKIYKDDTPGERKMKTFLEFAGFPPSPTSSAVTDVGTSSTLLSSPSKTKAPKSNNKQDELQTEPSILGLELRKSNTK